MGMMYKFLGRGKPEASTQGFTSSWASVVDSVLSIDVLYKNAALENLAQNLYYSDIHHEGSTYKESDEVEGINACKHHLLHNWEPAHNGLNSFRFSRLSKIHEETMNASKAYGETLAAYIEFKELLVQAHRHEQPLLERKIANKSRDGTQWDVLTQEKIESLMRLLEILRQQDRSLFDQLTNGVDVSDRFHLPLHAQAPIDLRMFYGHRSGFIVNFTW